jgi:6,7-dimethyl-8-ribityllumazine synthase
VCSSDLDLEVEELVSAPFAAGLATLVEDEKQAYARCIGSQINRGREAARAAASMIEIFRELDRSMPLMNDGKKRYA